MTSVQFTEKSRNTKTGPIAVSTTSSDTCPDACPLKAKGCYARHGNLGMMWERLSAAEPGTMYRSSDGRGTARALTWDMFCQYVAALDEGALWRHNQAGDLPGQGDTIDHDALSDLVIANHGRRGFTFTHKPLGVAHNAAVIEWANDNGFTINLSADNLDEADELVAADIAPVVVVLPESVQGNVEISTPNGHRVVVCPATYRDDVLCSTCQLCQRQRSTIVGFPAHGEARKSASRVANGGAA